VEDKIAREFYFFLQKHGARVSYELRPEKCKLSDGRTVESVALTYDSNGNLKLNEKAIEQYLEENRINKSDFSIHWRDIMWDPK
jgi:hypothetical protein